MSNVQMSYEQYRHEIDRRLAAVRPARYYEDDESWMQPVIEWAVRNMPPGLREQAIEEGRMSP